jgi:hypothetical protein
MQNPGKPVGCRVQQPVLGGPSPAATAQISRSASLHCCCTQLPVFVTAMWASRRMALAPWPGLEAGGALWFPDLTVPALDLASQTAQASCAHNVTQELFTRCGGETADRHE